MFNHPLSFVVFPAGGRARTVLLSLALALVMIACPLASQAAYNIWKVADQSTKIPGFGFAQHNFTTLGMPALDGSDVVWYGEGSLNNVFGIFIHDGSTFTSSSVHVIATSLTYVPGENLQFTSYGQLPSVANSNVTFLGKASGASFSNEIGVYDATYTGATTPTVYKIADRGTSGLDTGLDMGSPDGGGIGDAAFLASFVGSDTSTKQGIFTHYGFSSLFKLADSDTNRPGSGSKFANFNRRPSMYGHKVFFYGQDTTNQSGVYASLYPFNSLLTVADSGTKAPGGNAEFSDFQSLSIDGNQVAFYGETTAGRGVYTATLGGALSKVADQSDFALIEPMAATNSGRVAFVGGPGYPCLYNQVNGNLELITDSLSSLGGKGMSLIKLGPQGLSGYSLAFWVRHKDHTEAIYRADRLTTTAFSQNEPLVAAISEEEFLAGNTLIWNLAITGDDLGLARPLWVGAEYTNAYLYNLSGAAVFSVTPPEEVDPENIYEVVVFDPESGEMLRDPVEVPGGVRLDFRELGFDDGVRSFAIRGATLDPDYRGRMPLGLIFSQAGSRPEIRVTRCTEFERCGER